MKRIIMFVLLFAALKVAGQTTGYLRFDTVKIMKQNGSCELYIINKTKDSLGLLTNVGGGLTQFIKPKMLNDSTIVIGLDTLSIPGAGGSGSRFGLDDITATGTRAFDANGNIFKIDSVSQYYLTTKTKTSGVDKGLYNKLEMDNSNIYLIVSPSTGPSPRSYGFSAHSMLTQMFARGHVSGNDGYVQADTTQVLLESDPNRLEVRHDSVTLSNIEDGELDFRIRVLPNTVDTSYKALVSGPNGQVFLRPGDNGGGGGSTDTNALKDIYLPLHLNSAKTIDQANNNITFTGGGKVRADSFNLKKTFTPFITGDSIVGFGHSIMANQLASVSDSGFLTRVGRSHSLYVSNQGVPSSAIWSAVKIQMSWINAGHNAYTAYMPSLNDVRNTNILSAGNRTTINSIVNGTKAMWMNHMAKTSVGASDGSLTRSGGWNTNWNATVEAGKKTNAAYTTSAGAYIEYTFTDSTVGVQFMGNSSGGASTVTIAIDGGTVETFNLNSQHDGNSGSYMPTAKYFTGLSNASHTIRVTNTSGGLMIVDYFTNLRDAATAPPVCFFHEPYLDATGYSGGQASDAAIDTINVKYDSLRNALPAPWKARTIVARTNTRYIATTSSGLSGDHVHPNDLGHHQIALAEGDAVATIIGADSGTVQYGTDGYLYADAKRIPFVNTLGLGDVINNNPVLSTPADIRGSTFEFNGFSRIGLNFLKIGSPSEGALAHGTLGVQGPLGGVAILNRNNDTTKGFIYYASDNRLNLYDAFNNVNVAVRDTSFRYLFRNNAADNTLSVPSATVHIGGNNNGVAGHTPLKIKAGALVATPEDGAIEYDGTHWYASISSTRYQLDQQGGGSDGNGIYGGNGSLSGNTTITGAGNTLTMTGTQSSAAAFNVANTGNGIAISGTTSGTGSAITGSNSNGGAGIFGSSSSGTGLVAESTTGEALSAYVIPSSTNARATIGRLTRYSSGTASNGISGSFDWLTQSSNGSAQRSNMIASVWTDATTATRTSTLEIYGVNSGTEARKLAIAGNGQITADGYGSGTHTGTPTGSLQVTSGGAVIEGPALASGTYTPTLTAVSNTSSPLLDGARYTRVGNIVTFSLRFSVTTTSGSTSSSIRVTVPVSSSFNNANNAAGTNSGLTGRVEADATNDELVIAWVSGTGGTETITVTGQYTIL